MLTSIELQHVKLPQYSTGVFRCWVPAEYPHRGHQEGHTTQRLQSKETLLLNIKIDTR
jgi:hypothetical protein